VDWLASGFPLPVSTRTSSAGMTGSGARRGAKPSLPGVWGCPPIPFVSPQEWGPEGLKRRFRDSLDGYPRDWLVEAALADKGRG